jgi:hypothetical protein
MIVRNPPQDAKVFLDANATDTSFPSRVPTSTQPAKMVPADTVGNDTLELVPFGVGSGNNFNMRIIGWRCVSPTTAGGLALWVPTPIATLAVTLGTAATGVANTAVGASQYFATSVVLTDGQAAVPSAPSGTIARIIVGMDAFQGFELIFDRNSSATSANCLYSKY